MLIPSIKCFLLVILCSTLTSIKLLSSTKNLKKYFTSLTISWPSSLSVKIIQSNFWELLRKTYFKENFVIKILKFQKLSGIFPSSCWEVVSDLTQKVNITQTSINYLLNPFCDTITSIWWKPNEAWFF